MLRVLFVAVVPPPLVLPRKGYGIPFAACYVGIVLTIFIQQFTVLGWAVYILGSKRDVFEHFEMLSYPLAWIDSNFLITPSKSVGDISGILAANSYFGAFAAWICANIVHAVFRRNKVAQLGITSPPVDLDD